MHDHCGTSRSEPLAHQQLVPGLGCRRHVGATSENSGSWNGPPRTSTIRIATGAPTATSDGAASATRPLSRTPGAPSMSTSASTNGPGPCPGTDARCITMQLWTWPAGDTGVTDVEPAQ